MRVGFLGLGKLGLPCALAVESKGHEVKGHDPDPGVAHILATKALPYMEEGAQALLTNTKIEIVGYDELAKWADIVFVAIQTPHDERFEGITPLPVEKKDFDYSYLSHGVGKLAKAIESNKKNTIVVIISTVLPGTIRREIFPIVGENTKLCYNPFFIAMGTTIHDFLNPEFVLFGTEHSIAAAFLRSFYKTIHSRPFVPMSIESAELTKVAYNTFITSKIVIVNLLMEICHKIPGSNVDEVCNALKMATDRIVSPKYMDGGMGDGGGCHPRDNIALSWLAERLDLSHDIYREFMLARENQTKWFAEMLVAARRRTGFKEIVIVGKAFKKGTNLTIGSPSVLLKNLLGIAGVTNVEMWDPYVDEMLYPPFKGPAVFFIGTNHECFRLWKFPKRSVVLDPWGMIGDQEGVEVIRIGRK